MDFNNKTAITRRTFVFVLGCVLLGATVCSAESAKREGEPKQCRVILNCDEINLFRYQLRWLRAKLGRDPNTAEVKAMLEHVVDEHAKAKVDRLVQCIFSLPWGASTANFKTFNRAPDRGFLGSIPGFSGFEDDGNDVVQFLLERSRKNGMQFLAGLRMNDRHPKSDQQPFFTEHPQWHLGPGMRGAVDYKHEGVRDAVLAFTEEVLQRYDVDGIELDWMRHCHVFKPSQAEENAPLLVDFMTKMRKVVDDAARRRGRDKLLLGVRVPQTVEECRTLGFDLQGWAQSGVDYICPADFFCIDFNIKVEDFAKLTQGTDCELYPSIFGTISIGGASRRGLTHEQFRAAAHNYYTFGAHGVSPYNFYTQFMIFPGNEFGKAPPEFLLNEWPRSLDYLTALRDPDAVAGGDKHYLYYPLWPGKTPTGAPKHQVIELARDQAAASGSTRLRIADDLASSQLAASLEFKVAGMVEEDHLAVTLNGKVVGAEDVRREFDADGQSKQEGREIPAFYLYQIPLSSPPMVLGDNELKLRLTKSTGTENLVAQEFEIFVLDVESAIEEKE